MQQNLLTPKPKTWAMRMVEDATGQPIEELLRERYIDQGRTLADVAASVGLHEGTLSRWMDDLGIPRRQRGPRGRKAA